VPPRGSSKQRRVDFVADFETTTKADDCRVWGWGIARIDAPDDVYMSHTIDEFVERVSGLNGVVYFHNLKFDGTFILDWLMNNGYVWVDGTRKTERGEFTTLISDMGRWYSLKVVWETGHTTEFRDSLNKLPMPLARVATSFKLDEGKGEIDYHKERPVGYVMTAEERDYLRRDVSIIAKAMRITLEQGMTKLTVGADSLTEYKDLLGAKLFERMFPVLPEAMDAEIRKAYRGGWTYADERFKQKRQSSGCVLDVNSLYPYIMASTLLPYGQPTYQPGKVTTSDEYPLAIFSVTFTAKLKPRHVPCIQVKGSSIFTGTEYVKNISEPTTLSVTNVDWDLWNEHYDIEVESWDGGWKFRGVHGVFDEYIDKWSRIKAESTGGLRELAKLHLNSLYGKFATNPNVTSKIPYLKDGVVAYYRGPDETRKPVYTAMGVFITAYARALTIRAAQDNYDVFAYADTDSLHLLTDTVPSSIDVHPSKLGAWKLEYHFAEALYIRPKVYMERMHDGSYVNRVAGLPEAVSSQMTFETAYDGAVLTGKKQQMNVPGGMILKEIPWNLRY
jgi:hypothetical protein